MVPTSHMMVPTITLLSALDFYLLFKFNIYKKIYSTNITHDGTYIIFNGTTPTKRVWVL
jgi:multisubunit Na+/H+ antiporter MnhC subunit